MANSGACKRAAQASKRGSGGSCIGTGSTAAAACHLARKMEKGSAAQRIEAVHGVHI